MAARTKIIVPPRRQSLADSDEIIVADLFSGGGGIDEAVRRLRERGMPIRVGWSANHWPLAVDFHRRRHPDTPVFCQDLCQFDFRRIPGRVDIVWASFSCQGSSEAAQPARASNAELATAHDHLRSSAWAVVSAVLAKQPKAFIAENVEQIVEWAPPPILLLTCPRQATAEREARDVRGRTGWLVRVRKAPKDKGWLVERTFEKGILWRHWLRTFALAGYHVTTQVVSSAAWGVPQRRRRMIIVGHLDGAVPIIEPQIASEATLEPILDFDVGPWTSISEITKPGARERLDHAHELFGGRPCWGQHVSHPGAWGRPLTQPSTTVTTQNQHWMAHRGKYRLWTVPETSQVMDFPPAYFDGVPRTNAIVMAGNAVPPGMGAGVFEQVVPTLR
jgi:DNA (cytosine-5)-methyltransferase 1